MKEERLTVLSMLEKGIITADEAEKLLKVLKNNDTKDRINKEEISSSLSNVLNKAGEALGVFAKSVGEKAEFAAKEVEPIIKKVAHKAVTAAGDVKNYAEKKRQECEDVDSQFGSEDADEFYDLSDEECKELDLKGNKESEVVGECCLQEYSSEGAKKEI